MSIQWDNHLHSAFSGDCTVPLEEMVTAARNASLRGITLTDHLDWDYKERPGLFDLDLPAYQEAVCALQQKYSASDFEILFGLELGLQPHLGRKHKNLLNSCSFDYVIGSSHVVDGLDPYYPCYFQEHGIQNGCRRYYESILENIEAFDGFDAYGHLDYIFRYTNDAKETVDTYTGYKEIVDAILETLIQKDKALEVNTGAYRCGLSQPNPCPGILKRYRDLGGALLTIGADAHKPKHVALAFDTLAPLLKNLGFTEYAVYQKRVPVFYPL